LIPNPIRKVLSTMEARQVRALLMGGQACVFYGAAEFSRDIDFAVMADLENWERLQAALQELQAKCIAVPPCDRQYLLRGFALHFRCQHSEVLGLRIDVMAVLRGVDEFSKLWERRVTLTDSSGEIYNLLSLPDLVQAKKTQRGKDWPMIQRLVEADYLIGRAQPEPGQVAFWLRELRSPELLAEAAARYPEDCRQAAGQRPLLQHATGGGDFAAIAAGLDEEERQERERDQAYWQPLKAELERLRHPK
jgi:hypothetical protein